jgi:hypothetical protein
MVAAKQKAGAPYYASKDGTVVGLGGRIDLYVEEIYDTVRAD